MALMKTIAVALAVVAIPPFVSSVRANFEIVNLVVAPKYDLSVESTQEVDWYRRPHFRRLARPKPVPCPHRLYRWRPSLPERDG